MNPEKPRGEGINLYDAQEALRKYVEARKKSRATAEVQKDATPPEEEKRDRTIEDFDANTGEGEGDKEEARQILKGGVPMLCWTDVTYRDGRHHGRMPGMWITERGCFLTTPFPLKTGDQLGLTMHGGKDNPIYVRGARVIWRTKKGTEEKGPGRAYRGTSLTRFNIDRI